MSGTSPYNSFVKSHGHHAQSHIYVGAENMFPLRSELRVKTSYEVRHYFVRSSALLRSKFGATSFECVRTCESTSYEVRSNFERTSCKFQSNFERTSSQLREVRTSHGNIISAATVATKTQKNVLKTQCHHTINRLKCPTCAVLYSVATHPT